MKNKLTIIEIILTAILSIVICFEIGTTVHKRVEKGSGQLTTENYTNYMKVDCSLGNAAVGDGTVLWYNYYITVTANAYYMLENVTVSYSLESDGADLPDGTLTATIKAGERYSKKSDDKLAVPMSGGMLGMLSNRPTLKITVKSVSGTYRYKV